MIEEFLTEQILETTNGHIRVEMQNTEDEGKISRAIYKKHHQRHNSQNDFYKENTEDRNSGMIFSMY